MLLCGAGGAGDGVAEHREQRGQSLLLGPGKDSDTRADRDFPSPKAQINIQLDLIPFPFCLLPAPRPSPSPRMISDFGVRFLSNSAATFHEEPFQYVITLTATRLHLHTRSNMSSCKFQSLDLIKQG